MLLIMPIDIFSKRQKILRGEVPDVYQYDSIPEPLRVQIIHIMTDGLGDCRSSQTEKAYSFYSSNFMSRIW